MFWDHHPPNDYKYKLTEQYNGVFVIVIPNAYYHNIIPKSSYLTYSYTDSYKGTRIAMKQIKAYQKLHGYTLKGNALELWEVDIHKTSLEEEYITEVQVKFYQNN